MPHPPNEPTEEGGGGVPKALRDAPPRVPAGPVGVDWTLREGRCRHREPQRGGVCVSSSTSVGTHLHPYPHPGSKPRSPTWSSPPSASFSTVSLFLRFCARSCPWVLFSRLPEPRKSGGCRAGRSAGHEPGTAWTRREAVTEEEPRPNSLGGRARRPLRVPSGRRRTLYLVRATAVLPVATWLDDDPQTSLTRHRLLSGTPQVPQA